nr:hypothetical protein [Bacteroidales bacterium]
ENIPDLFAQRPLVIQGKYKKARGKIIITGKTPEGDYKKVINIDTEMESRNNEAVKYLWAREKIASLGDYKTVGVNVEKEITELGLAYHLMTEYTSFVAVDKVVRETGEVVTVKQPLTLPEGVKDTAVGYGYGIKKVKTYNNKNYNKNYLGGNGRQVRSGLPSKGGLMQTEPAYDMALEQEVKLPYALPATSRVPVFITDADLPSGVSLDDVEEDLFSAVRAELELYFGSRGVKEIKVELKVKNGKVVSVSGTDSELKKILQKVNFDGVSGTIKLVLGVM